MISIFKTVAEKREEQMRYDMEDAAEFLAEHAELSFIAGAGVLAINRHIADMATDARLKGTDHAKETAALSKVLGLSALLVDEIRKIEDEFDLYGDKEEEK